MKPSKAIQSSFKLLAIGISSFLLSTASFALPEVSEDKGWTGYVAFGGGYADITSNEIAGNRLLDLDKDPWNGNNQKASSRSEGFASIGGEVTWTLGRRNAVFLGSSMVDRLTQNGVLQLGWRKTTDSAGTFQVGFLTNPTPTPARIYNDPYNDDGSNRGVTDQTTKGARFQWDKIFNTNFELTLTTLTNDIDSENSGAGYSGVCAANCQRSLDREGDLMKAEIGYLFKLFGGDHLLRPSVEFNDFDADGDAKDYDGVMGKLTYSWVPDGNWGFVSNVTYGERDYDTVNPIFAIGGNGPEQDTDIIVIDASLLYDLPFGNENRWQLVTNVTYGEGDSDIDFHDSEITKVSANVLYKFGKVTRGRDRIKN
jgi:hypothetical protein